MAVPDPTQSAVALIVAFAIQQTVEIVDILSSGVLALLHRPQLDETLKKGLAKALCLLLGGIVVPMLKLDILQNFTGLPGLHGFITVIALAGGTEGVNSVLKFVVYAKENKKNQAAALIPAATPHRDLIGRK
jgi:hypothetical protein